MGSLPLAASRVTNPNLAKRTEEILRVAVINLAFVPPMFFGDDAPHFYSAVGWGTAVAAGTLLLHWTLAAGIATLSRPRPVETPGVRRDRHRPNAAG